MAFIDELTFYAKAGKGGNGVVRWRHEKGKEFSGAAGGNGGGGGDVYAHAVRDIHLLAKYKHKKEFEAGNGEDGKRSSMHGGNGDHMVIDLPIGSIITNQETGKKYSLLKEGEKILLLKGGRGGLGNEHFKASTNTTPKEWTPGKPGEEGNFYIELELVADAGFVGLPNAGKSSLLNELTNAKSKVASYAFTTLDPSLGNMEGYILADIPGLIEGASEGKGLGHKFLRHIKRTKFIMHCLSLENEDLNVIYKGIRKELKNYGGSLDKKPEIIILTKTDATTHERIVKETTSFKKKHEHVFSVSILDDVSIKHLKDNLVKIFRASSKKDGS
ncbi:GTPase ObgE [Candidatus Microgenomates bacterium]|nr:GTPase ObgE [Candidatus Microgenomates bacterium]